MAGWGGVQLQSPSTSAGQHAPVHGGSLPDSYHSSWILRWSSFSLGARADPFDDTGRPRGQSPSEVDKVNRLWWRRTGHGSGRPSSSQLLIMKVTSAAWAEPIPPRGVPCRGHRSLRRPGRLGRINPARPPAVFRVSIHTPDPSRLRRGRGFACGFKNIGFFVRVSHGVDVVPDRRRPWVDEDAGAAWCCITRVGTSGQSAHTVFDR